MKDSSFSSSLSSSLSKRSYAFFFIILSAGIILHAVPYIYNRSLWIDEAMLASSVLTRGFSDLLSYPLDFGQSAPVGYLYIVKTLTEIFGRGEYVLRIWSLLSFMICTGLLYAVLKSVLKVRQPEIFTLLFVFLPYYMNYSNEFKPYMSDNMFVILSLLIFMLYHKGHISLAALIASYSVILWFSFVSVFFIASGMIIIVLELVSELFKSGKKLKTIMKISGCMIVALSFLINYKFWLSSTSSNAGGAGFFALTRFIFIPKSMQDIKTMYRMLHEMLAPILSIDYTFTAAVLILSLTGIFSLLRDKNERRIVIAVILNVLLMCIASSLGFYPVGARLMQFLSIEIIIFAAPGFDVIDSGLSITGHKRVFAFVILVIMLVPFIKTFSAARPSKVYRYGTEAAENMRYLRENIMPEDKIYVSGHGTPLFLYESDYAYFEPLHGKTWGEYGAPFVKSNCIFGQTNMIFDYKKPYSYDGHLNTKAIDEDVSLIIQNDSVYIFSSHSDKGVPEIVSMLRNYGTVEEVVSLYENPLYHFRKE